MAGVPGEPAKKRCIDDIIEHMTADMSYEGQYILLGSPPSTGGGSVWPDFQQQAPTQPPPGPQAPRPPSMFYPQQVQRDNNEMIGMVDVGGGNYFNVVFSKPNSQDFSQPPRYMHYPPPTPPNLIQPHIIDYTQRAFPENLTNGCLIENVVGNWVPNRNGTYSPFGGLQQDDRPQEIRLQSTTQSQVKKRIVAEVKPMRPSYSDVLAKSPPLTPPPITKLSPKPVTSPPIKTEVKKQHTKTVNTTTGTKSNTKLKRQSSSGSEETLIEKSKTNFKRWSSQELLTFIEPDTSTSEVKKEKKKKTKSKYFADKEDKNENVCRERESKTANKKGTLGMTIGQTKHYIERSCKPKIREEYKSSSSKVERHFNNSRPSRTKRSQNNSKRKHYLGELFKKWKELSWYYLSLFTTWFMNLLWNVTTLSCSLLLHIFNEACEISICWLNEIRTNMFSLLKKWLWFGKKEKRFPKRPPDSSLPGSLTHNISLPTTGEEAMKRLLSCKGKDPYSILGVTNSCTDEEIKKYYKSQALLVHPDKNSQPGAEEAFKILVHAFDLIAEPEKRAAYDRYVAETNQVEQAWSELSNLLSQLHEKMEYAANTIRCNNCGKRHKRELTERPNYAARFCAQCKIHHSARESDMWAESQGWGWWRCRYYACMDGAIYDITQWANCQGNAIQRVKPDAHDVQYRVLLGRDHQPPPEPDIDDILNSLFPQDGSGRAKKKSKKNK